MPKGYGPAMDIDFIHIIFQPDFSDRVKCLGRKGFIRLAATSCAQGDFKKAYMVLKVIIQTHELEQR
jgi:hypothetical protein